MKITVEKIKVNEEITYPCLMKSKNDETIILALKENEGGYVSGVVVDEGASIWKVGHHSKIWIKDCFKPFNGIVTLQND